MSGNIMSIAAVGKIAFTDVGRMAMEMIVIIARNSSEDFIIVVGTIEGHKMCFFSSVKCFDIFYSLFHFYAYTTLLNACN